MSLTLSIMLLSFNDLEQNLIEEIKLNYFKQNWITLNKIKIRTKFIFNNLYSDQNNIKSLKKI